MDPLSREWMSRAQTLAMIFQFNRGWGWGSSTPPGCIMCGHRHAEGSYLIRTLERKQFFAVYFNAPGIHMSNVLSRESPVGNSFQGVCYTSRYARYNNSQLRVCNVWNSRVVKVSSVRSKSFIGGYERPGKALNPCSCVCCRRGRKGFIGIPVCVLTITLQ